MRAFPGPGLTIGNSAPGGWSAQEIIYYILSSPSSSGWTFLDGSGIKAGGDIAKFVTAVLADEVGALTPFPSNIAAAPNLTVWKPCWVVVELDDQVNWCFSQGATALLTQIDHQADYAQLTFVDSEGNFYPTVAPSSPISCSLLYFAAVNPADNRDDAYELLTTWMGSSLTIDPYIKNRGGVGRGGG